MLYPTYNILIYSSLLCTPLLSTPLHLNPTQFTLVCSALTCLLNFTPNQPRPIQSTFLYRVCSTLPPLPSPLIHCILFCSTIPSLLDSTPLCFVLFYSALLSCLLHSTPFCSVLFYSALLCCTLPYCTSLHYNLLNSDILCFFLLHPCPLSYNTTQYNTIYTQYTQFSRTNIQKKSLSRIGVRLWNKIPEDFRKIKISFIQQFRKTRLQC